jgi:glycosyltransferase involved in cell wall biosynthesis
VTPSGGVRLTFVTDIITPYMAAVFEALAGLSQLHVVFCSASGTRAMPWDFAGALSFEHEVVSGLTLRRRNPDATDYYLSPRIARAVFRRAPDAVIAAGYSIPTAYAGLYCALRRRPLLIHSDGTSETERSLSRGQRLARRVLLPRAAACVANSGPAADRFREMGVPHDRIFMAPHSTNLAPMWEAARGRDYGSGAPLRLLTVGRLIPRKGLDRLVRATAAAVYRGADVRLRMVGNGPDEAPLRDLARELGIGERVALAGFMDQDELPSAYAEADAFAFPTLEDPFGFVLLEAAAAGLPAIASPRAGATADLIADERNGLVADPDDLDAMAAAIARLASDRDLRERLGRAAYESTLTRTPEAAARGYLEAVAAARAGGRSAARQRDEELLGGR